VNYLAHLYLSGHCPERMIGGLLGDFVKGPLRGDYPPAIEAGILLHRKIDVFTDNLPAVRTALSRFEPPYRRFGGILLDLWYPHFMADNRSIYRIMQRFYRTGPNISVKWHPG
jgi:acyl carrier protein phosphodiesterase